MPGTHTSNRRKARAEAAGAPVTVDTPTGSLVQYERFLPAAMKLAPADVRVARINVTRVLHNAARGVTAVLARRAEVSTIPNVSIDAIDSLADLGDAFAYAAGIVDCYAPIVGAVQAMVAQARQLRGKLLAKADVLVVDGIVPAATVLGIHKSKGFVDMANDCVQLARLFPQYAAAVPRSVVVDPADLQAADAIGRKLIATLRPPNVKKTPPPELVAAMDARDRLWTLFEQTWERNVWRAGANLFLRDVDAQVPPLRHATFPRRRPEPAPPRPTPVAVAA